MKYDTKNSYHERILKVQLYIQSNLYQNLTLEELARVACFSPYHFHRIFRGMAGETLAEHIRRLRLERAASLLQQTGRSITQLAFEAGYETVESFSRAFRSRFGINPGELRKNKDYHLATRTFQPQKKVKPTMKTEIKQIKPFRVIFSRHTGPYKECSRAWDRLCSWAGVNGLLQPGIQFVGLCYDDPDITLPEKIRYDACISVDMDIEPEGDIGVQQIEGGLYAMATHHGSYNKLSDTYAWLCGQWAPQNGYEIRSRPSLEVYLNSPEDNPEDELLTDVHIPIEKCQV